jgi:RND family efflux transporter MFP subunit
MRKGNEFTKWFILVAIVPLLITISGCGSESEIPTGTVEGKIKGYQTAENEATAALRSVTDWYDAVGTVRPRTETRIEAQVTAQVKEVKVNPGTKVQKGDILVVLDDRQYASKLHQAKQQLSKSRAGEKQADQAVIGAKAAFAQSESEYKRTKGFFEAQAATSRELEGAESGYLQAKAGLKKAMEALEGAKSGIRQAEEFVKEAKIALGYTRIIAPASGEVLNRLVQPGDMALPGKPLLMVRTSGFLRLEAFVREGLISKISPGKQFPVYIKTLNQKVIAAVEEIVPYADPNTRTFLVKASLPQITGIYPGMYGKLMIPVNKHKIVVIPLKAVKKVGQLELVDIKVNGLWQRRYVKTGRILGDEVEVLSGLEAGEIVGF